MGTSAALRMVPDEVILTISRLGVLQRLPDILPHDEVIDGIPKHTAGVDGVDVVDVADDRLCPAGEEASAMALSSLPSTPRNSQVSE